MTRQRQLNDTQPMTLEDRYRVAREVFIDKLVEIYSDKERREYAKLDEEETAQLHEASQESDSSVAKKKVSRIIMESDLKLAEVKGKLAPLKKKLLQDIDTILEEVQEEKTLERIIKRGVLEDKLS